MRSRAIEAVAAVGYVTQLDCSFSSPSNEVSVPISDIRKNILANYLGKAWTAVVGLLVPPIVIRLLGVELYGVVGIYTAISGFLSILDLGLATTLQREVARSNPANVSEFARTMRFVRTVEVLFWATGLLLGTAIALTAPLLVKYWIHVGNVPASTAVRTIRIMGACVMLQWPLGVYNGGLLSMQRQVAANVITVIASTARSIGGVVVLLAVSRRIEALYIWTALVMLLQVALTARAFWGTIPRPHRSPAFDLSSLLVNWKFSASIWGLSLLGILVAQLDKMAATKMLTLREIGYYTVASALPSSLGMLVGPIYLAVFPRLCQLASSGDSLGTARLYHSSCQLMSVALLPASTVLMLFAQRALYCWTGNADVAMNSRIPAAILIFGMMMNGLMNLPYGLQVANGWPQLLLRMNMITFPIMLLLVWPLGHYLGSAGVALTWAIPNTGYVLFGIYFLHRRLLPGEALQWLTEDVLLPLLGAVAGTLLVLLTAPSSPSRLLEALILASAAAVATLGAALTTKTTRAFMLIWARRVLAIALQRP